MNEISVAVIICTYKRENYINRNLLLLDRYCRKFIKHIFVIDNGSTLHKTLNSDFITVLPNSNLGGSSGFARGLHEVIKLNMFTHVFLMDDDITFSPDIINSGISELKQIDSDSWYSFPMCFQQTAGKYREICGFWDGIHIKLNYKNKEINKQINFKKKYNYASWFSLIMPISTIKEQGLPLPFFIKFDDIEYGLRCKPKISFNPKYIIYHQSINEKTKKYLEYYSIRNSFITNCLHFKFSTTKNSIRYFLKFLNHIFKGDLDKITYLNKGCKDFLMGPTALITANSEINHTYIQNLMVSNKNKVLLLLKHLLSFWLYIFKLMIFTNSVKKKYKQNFSYLTSVDFWSKYFPQI